MIQSQLIGVGILVAVALGSYLSHTERRDVPIFFLKFAALLLFGFVGARLYAVPLADWSFNVLDPREALGLGSVGGFLGVAASLTFLWFIKTPRHELETLMIGTFAVLGFARLGCHFDGCDFGSPYAGPFSVSYPSGTRSFDVLGDVPVFPFGAGLAIGIALLVAVSVYLKLKRKGVSSLLIGGFVTLRILAECARGTPTDWWGVVAMVVLGLMAIGVLSVTPNPSGNSAEAK